MQKKNTVFFANVYTLLWSILSLSLLGLQIIHENSNLQNLTLEKQTQELTYQLEDDQRTYEQALNDRDSQIRKMRDECQSLMMELQSLLDTKRTLDAEIAIYRKMLEGEEGRDGLKQVVDEMMKSHDGRQNRDLVEHGN